MKARSASIFKAHSKPRLESEGKESLYEGQPHHLVEIGELAVCKVLL